MTATALQGMDLGDHIVQSADAHEVEYTCRFCKDKRVAVADCSAETLAAAGFDLEKWKSMLSCNRCADFYTTKRKLHADIAWVCRALITARKGTNKQAQDAEGLTRTTLERKTRDYLGLCARHYGRHNNWEPVFVDGFMDKPDKAGAYLNYAFNMFRTGKWI